MQSKLQQVTGHCGECTLSPAEVQEDEIKNWIWVRLPDGILTNGSYEFTLPAKGSTLHEAIEDIGKMHPELKAGMLKAATLVLPHPALELSVNWVPVSVLQGLDTPVKGGDYVKFPASFESARI